MTYDIRHKSGSKNVTADAFSCVCVLSSLTSLHILHQSLGDLGYARLYHFVRQRYSCEDKSVATAGHVLR